MRNIKVYKLLTILVLYERSGEEKKNVEKYKTQKIET